MLLNALSLGGGDVYRAQGVDFDGSTYLPKGSDLSGTSDSKLLTVSMWFKRADKDLGYMFEGLDASGYGLQIYFQAGDNFGMYNLDSSGEVLELQSAATYTDDVWHHVLASVDMSDTNKRFLYFDDAADTPNWNTYNNRSLILSGFTDPTIGARQNNSDIIDWELAEVWIDFGTYLDISDADNRRKFITADKKPVRLGDTGDGPTGTAPTIFLSGDVSSWHTNKGTGGGFTEAGALTASGTSPSD